MASAIIPIVTALYLGSTFNLKTYQSGSADVYDPTTIGKKVQTINRSFTKSQYSLIESTTDARDFLDVSGDLSLKVMKGDIQFQGAGAYLRENTNRENIVELLVQVHHETVTETVPSYVEPNMDWISKSPESVGTHFVRSITYGGDLIAFVRFTARNRVEKEKIKAAVSSNLQFSGTLDVNAQGKFEKLQKDLQGMYNIEVRHMATVEPKSPPTTIKELMDLVEAYPDEIVKLNGGKGRPLTAELYPLTALKGDYPSYLTNKAVQGVLEDLEAKYDDIRVASEGFRSWNKKINNLDLTEEETEQITEFYAALKKAELEFNLAISKLDMSTDSTIKQFEAALQAYGENDDNVPNRYQRWLWRLRVEVGKEDIVFDKKSGEGASYIHWGVSTCDPSTSSTMYSGYGAGAPHRTLGGGTNMQCMASNDVSMAIKESSSQLSSMKPLLFIKPDNTGAERIQCSMCIALNASSVQMFVNEDDCPEEWKLDYNGYLMAEKDSFSGQKFMCMDDAPELKSSEEKLPEDSSTFVPVWEECKQCADGVQLVHCAVCSR